MMEYDSYEVQDSVTYARVGGEPLISSTSMRTQFNHDIEYEDRDEFSGASESKVLTFEDLHKSPDERGDSSEETFRMGEKVEAFHKSNEYQPGLIVAVNREANLYDVSFDDGSELMDLAPHFIRKVSPPAPLLGHGHHHRSHSHHHHDHHKKSSKPHDKSSSDPSSTSTSRIHYKPGDQVEALREGNKIWRFAVIAKTHHDHTYDVIYSDRVRENRLGYDLIRPLFEKTANTEDSAENDKANKKVDFPADDKNDIKPQQTQRQASKSKEHESVDHIDENVGLKVGLEVEARYHGGELYYPGTVTKVSNRNQTCDIRYEDGDRETFVPMDYIRPRSEDHSRGKSRAKKNDNINSGDNNKNGSDQRGTGNQQSSDGPAFAKDMAIEGNFQGKNLWYPGTITAIRVIQSDEEDGHEEYRYAVRYRDGDKEENVPEYMLRLPKLKKLVGNVEYDTDEPVVSTMKTPNNTPAHHATAPGAFASSEGKESKYNRMNVISSAAGDVMVASRPPLNSNSKRPVSSGNNQSQQHNSHRMTRPAPVERSESIMVIHGDDRNYQSEQRMPRQPLTPAPSHAAAAVNINGNNSFRHSNNSSNASSSKGNKTTPQQQAQSQQQQQQQQRVVESTPPINAMQAVRIEVNYHGQGVWYRGHLVKERKDGTVDVAYDDGDKESAVTLDRIRPLQQQAAQQEQRQQQQQVVMRIGDRVAANYQGQGRYYPGVIKKVWRENRFFDVLYDDGDEERKIPAEYVHRLEVNVKSSAPRVNNGNNSRPNTANGNRAVSSKTNVSSLALSPRGRWVEGSLVEMKATNDGDKEKWLVGRINRQLTTANGKDAAVDIKLLNGEIVQEVPVEFLRIPRKKSASVIPAMSLDMSSGSTGSSRPKGNGNGNGNDAVMLNEKDITALRLLLQQKDAEIERLKVGAVITSTTKQQQPQGRPPSSAAYAKAYRSSDTVALDATAQSMYHQLPVIAEGKGASNEIAALTKANDDLKRSVAFLGQKFTIVVEELVQVKQREEQLQRQVQKQADMIRQVVDGQKKMATMLNNSYRN